MRLLIVVITDTSYSAPIVKHATGKFWRLHQDFLVHKLVVHLFKLTLLHAVDRSRQTEQSGSPSSSTIAYGSWHKAPPFRRCYMTLVPETENL